MTRQILLKCNENVSFDSEKESFSRFMIDVITTLIVLIAFTITLFQQWHYAMKYCCLSNVFLKASSIKLPYGNF